MMKNIAEYFVKGVVDSIRENAIKELDSAKEKLLKSDSIETLNFLNSGITVNLKNLKIQALGIAKKCIKKNEKGEVNER